MVFMNFYNRFRRRQLHFHRCELDRSLLSGQFREPNPLNGIGLNVAPQEVGCKGHVTLEFSHLTRLPARAEPSRAARDIASFTPCLRVDNHAAPDAVERLRVDLTDDLLSWSPAVCGGIMDIFVEPVSDAAGA